MLPQSALVLVHWLLLLRLLLWWACFALLSFSLTRIIDARKCLGCYAGAGLGELHTATTTAIIIESPPSTSVIMCTYACSDGGDDRVWQQLSTGGDGNVDDDVDVDVDDESESVCVLADCDCVRPSHPSLKSANEIEERL